MGPEYTGQFGPPKSSSSQTMDESLLRMYDSDLRGSICAKSVALLLVMEVDLKKNFSLKILAGKVAYWVENVGEQVWWHHGHTHERADEEEESVHEPGRCWLVDVRQDRAAAAECRAAY